MSKEFFHVVGRPKFLDLLKSFPAVGTETVDLKQAAGRVLSEDLTAREDLPLVNRATMDGYAVRARDTFGATDANPAYLEFTSWVNIEQAPEFELGPGQCAGITTGGSLPEGADAVVMVEYTEEVGARNIEIRKSVAPWENVMLRGEDAKQGKAFLSAGTRLRPQEIGLAAAMGKADIPVFKKPRVGIISTGDELVEVGSDVRPGQVRDVNSHTLAALVASVGADPVMYGIVKDEPELLDAAVARAVDEADAVFVSGGSSVGARDYTIGAIQALPGSDVLTHGVGISPGKPTILARVGDTAVWGLPGQVTSAQVVMLVLGLPFLAHISGDKAAFDTRKHPRLTAVLARNIASKQGREDYVRVRLEHLDGQAPLAHPVLGKSGLLKTLVMADGLVRIDAEAEGLEAGTRVEVRLI